MYLYGKEMACGEAFVWLWESVGWAGGRGGKAAETHFASGLSLSRVPERPVCCSHYCHMFVVGLMPCCAIESTRGPARLNLCVQPKEDLGLKDSSAWGF